MLQIKLFIFFIQKKNKKRGICRKYVYCFFFKLFYLKKCRLFVDKVAIPLYAGDEARMHMLMPSLFQLQECKEIVIWRSVLALSRNRKTPSLQLCCLPPYAVFPFNRDRGSSLIFALGMDSKCPRNVLSRRHFSTSLAAKEIVVHLLSYIRAILWIFILANEVITVNQFLNTTFYFFS